MLKIVAIDAQGKRRKLDAQRLEIELPGGRRVVLDAPHLAWGDLDLLAESETGTPVLNMQPAGCNLMTIRVVAHHDATAASPILGLEVQKALNGDDKFLPRPKKPQIRNWAGAALERDAEVTVRLVGEEEGRSLNRDYRGKDYPTNVLTFTYDGGEPATSSAPLLGDLVLCVPVVVREALEQNKSPEAHYAHLVVHGMLHLQGYDHEDETDAERMEARERAVLSSLGYSDPYA